MFDVSALLVGFVLGALFVYTLYKFQNVIRRTFLIGTDISSQFKNVTRVSRLPDSELLEIPSVEIYGKLTEHEGWMNVYLAHYNSETFDISNAVPAYVSLNGNILRISYTKRKILRQAIWNEQKYKLKFTNFDEFNIANCDVKLLPNDLKIRKRWLRRYPIYIANESCNIEPFPLPNENQSNNFCEDNVYNTHRTQRDSNRKPNGSNEISVLEVPTVETPLYLFGRSDRQKEDWFRRLVAAVKYNTTREVNQDVTKRSISIDTHQSGMSFQKCSKPQRFIRYVYPPQLESGPSQYLSLLSNYQVQVITEMGVCVLKPLTTDHEDESSMNFIELSISKAKKMNVAPNLLWFNVFVARVVSDLIKSPKVMERFHCILQKRVSNIGLPRFIEYVSVTKLSLGETVPRVHCSSNPMLDQRGIWANIDVTYEGKAFLLLETKFNLLKLTDEEEEENELDVQVHDNIHIKRAMAYNTENDTKHKDDADIYSNRSSAVIITNDFRRREGAERLRHKKPKRVKNKFLRFMNNIVQSYLFQCASRHPCIRPTIEELSKSKITLLVELKGLAGTMSLNIPPPPSDRIWFAFHDCPYMHLTTRSVMGERLLTSHYIKRFIEKTLIKQIRKRLILPNMCSIVIPSMDGSLPN